MNIYQYPSEPSYQHPSYQQCSLIVDHTKEISVTRSDQFEPLISHNVNVQQANTLVPLEGPLQTAKNRKNKEKQELNIDTSNFTIEERLVAAVWVHERKSLKMSIRQIRQDFRQRFGREAPAKNTLMMWEHKLFATGSVCDAPRAGRPIKRQSRIDEVVASLKNSPTLSLRARARALHLPRTTLRNILMHDLPHHLSLNKDKGTTKNKGKQVRKVVKRQVQKVCEWQHTPTARQIQSHNYT